MRPFLRKKQASTGIVFIATKLNYTNYTQRKGFVNLFLDKSIQDEFG